MKTFDVRGNRRTGYFVDIVDKEKNERMLGAERFNSKKDAEMYIERQEEIARMMSE